MRKLQNWNKKFNQNEISKKQLKSVKGGGWGKGEIVNAAKNCPPPHAGLWKKNEMYYF